MTTDKKSVSIESETLFCLHEALISISFLIYCCFRFRSPYESKKQGMRTIRTGFEFRMELTAHKPWMICYLNHLDDTFVR